MVYHTHTHTHTHIHTHTPHSYILVYNLGKWTLSLTLLRVVGGLYRTLASHTLPSLGGRLIDTAMVELLASEVQR